MKLVRFLKPMPEHSANIGDEMAFSDEKAAEFVAKGRAVLITTPPLVVELEAAPEIVGKSWTSNEVPMAPTALIQDGPSEETVSAGLGGDYEDEPVRRGPGRPRKHF